MALRDVLRLTRASLAPTAAADSLAGYLIALHGAAFAWRTAVPLAATSICIYMAGMVLNDLSDLERDRTLHPDRVLPSGRISPVRAALLFATLAVAGGILASLALQAAAGIAAALIGAVLLYDTAAKRWAVPGALAMGLCRTLNMAMGMAAARGLALGSDPWLWGPPILLGIYVTALTLLSTLEERHPGVGRWVGLGVRGIIPLDALLVALRGSLWEAAGILALLPLVLGLRRRLPGTD